TLGLLPLGAHPTLPLQTVQSRIKGSGLNLQNIRGLGAQRQYDPITMLRSPLQGTQDKHVEGALQQFDAVLIFFFLFHSRRHSTSDGGRLSTARRGRGTPSESS